MSPPWNDFDALKAIAEQRSAAEVPGFHARTVIDDTIGKLWGLRQHLVTPIPDDLPALLDEIEELTEKAIDLALDPDAEPINDGEGYPAPELMNWTDHLKSSASRAFFFCSCGQPGLCE